MNELADLRLQVNTLSSQLSNAYEAIQGLRNEASQFRTSLANNLHSIQTHAEEAKRISDNHKTVASLVVAIREEFARNLNNSQKAFLQALEEKCRIFNEMEKEQEHIKSLVSSALSTMETVALDAKTATLKANNNDIIVQIHNKKLDNIFQKLKNLELTR